MSDHQNALNKTTDAAKPCPFCGELDIIPHEENPAKFHIQCRRCGAMGPEATTIGDACLQWNRAA